MDEKDTLQIKIDQAKATLPQDTQDAISAIDWRSIVLGMREKRGYSFSQLEDLETETELMLYGLINPEEYPKELENRMKISKEESTELINELNSLIFQKIREELVKISERKIPEIKKEIDTKPSYTGLSDTSTMEASREQKNTEVLNQSGIKIIKEESKEEKPDMHTEKREDMLKDVENPDSITPKTQAPSFLNQKLNNSFTIPPKETIHNDPVIKNSAIGGKVVDPYREPIE